MNQNITKQCTNGPKMTIETNIYTINPPREKMRGIIRGYNNGMFLTNNNNNNNSVIKKIKLVFMKSPKTNKKNKKIITPDNFNEMEISTKTVIVFTNWNIDLNLLFSHLPIINVNFFPKKKDMLLYIFNHTIENGSIIFVKYGNDTRGTTNKKSKKNKHFRNSLTIVMAVTGKFVNFKISNKGKIQITGCKNDNHSEEVIMYIWKHITEINKTYPVLKSLDNSLLCCNNEADNILQNSDSKLYNDLGSNPSVIINNVMTNIDFSLGFTVQRELLHGYILTTDKFVSIFESSFGYTGINVKTNVVYNDNYMIKSMIFKDGEWKRETIKYNDFFNLFSEKEKKRLSRKIKYHTFLIFQSGDVIQSGPDFSLMEDVYKEFVTIILKNRSIFEENI